MIDFDLCGFYRSISRRDLSFRGCRVSSAEIPQKLERDAAERISRVSGLFAPRRVSPKCNALIRIKIPRRGGRSLELAPNFFPITKEAHFMTGGSLFLLQRWRWSSCWGDPSISWLRKASCHVSVDPLVYYTVYIHFFSSLRRGKLRLYDSGLLKPSPMLRWLRST